ncbi:MAG: hypothetical protein JSW01_06135 [Candidatus Bathyarchaeota archaeon]|nr:MAG: hypothetical protein JSW01_06135 [Candidatus Bathyarchaeota archaeon]
MGFPKQFIPLTIVWGITAGELFLYMMDSTGMLFNRLGLDPLEATTVLVIFTTTSIVFYFIYETFDWKGILIVPPIGAAMNMSFFRFPQILSLSRFHSNIFLLAAFWSLVLIPPYFLTKKFFQ